MHAFLLAFGFALFLTPKIIRLAHRRRLYDLPNERSAHSKITPRLGGVGIFAGLAVACSATWLDAQAVWVFVAVAMVFGAGLVDDLKQLPPSVKFGFQILAALLLIFGAGLRIESMGGVLGIFELPFAVSAALTLVTFVGVVNAFNLIDGVNGLAASLGILACLFFGTWFLAQGDPVFATLAFATVGGLCGFLYFNFRKESLIFMGDGGSLTVGLVCAILCVAFLGKVNMAGVSSFRAAPVVILAAVVVPVFDTLRVFAWRVAHGRSPFCADRNHLHHFLLEMGMTHFQVTGTIVLYQASLLGFSLWLQAVEINSLLIMTVCLAAMPMLSLQAWIMRKRELTTLISVRY